MLRLERLRLLHVHVKALPTPAWTAQQIVEALPEETRSRTRFAIAMGSMERSSDGTSRAWACTKSDCASSPWQDANTERVVGSLRRECLDHIILSQAPRVSDPLGVCSLLQPCAHPPRFCEGCFLSDSGCGRQLSPVTSFPKVRGIGMNWSLLAARWVFGRHMDRVPGVTWTASSVIGLSAICGEGDAYETQAGQQQARRFGQWRKQYIAEVAGSTVGRRKHLGWKSPRRTEITANCRQGRVGKTTDRKSRCRRCC